jgi:outer membrane protein assembly factor BamA
VTLVERKPNIAEFRLGYSSGEGVRTYLEYTYSNLFGYAVALSFRGKFSYQPFLFRGLYNQQIMADWEKQRTVDRVARRLSAGITLPHTPVLGSTVRTSLEFVNVLDLQRDFLVNKINPFVFTMAYEPVRWFYATLSSDIEMNKFVIFSETNSAASICLANPYYCTFANLPTGDTTVVAGRLSLTFDWRDIRLGATKGGFVSVSSELVKSLAKQADQPEQEFIHFSGAAGAYVRLFELTANRPVVFAFELAGGFNRNVLNCSGEGYDSKRCNTYPDRLFYVGGPNSHRGFQLQQMLPQETIDSLRDLTVCTPDPITGQVGPGCDTARSTAPHGGNVFFNPRVELRVPAFGWGGFVLFLDAANLWRDPLNFKPWQLRYAVGPGLSADTPIGPIALDIGINLAPHTNLGEPTWQFNFSIGRF